MIRPAICYKEKLEAALKDYFYTDDMMYYVGDVHNSLLDIEDKSGRYQYAVVDTEGKLIGYISYWVDFYSSCAYSFGAFSFDRGNPIMGKDLFDLLNSLVKQFHRVEFKAVSGNPAIRGYDNFINRYDEMGTKHVMKDVFKDTRGNYHDIHVYEIINEESEIK